MQVEGLFKENLERWEIFCPEGAKKIRDLTVAAVSEVAEEAVDYEKWKDELDVEKFKVLYVYGIQKGEPYLALKEWVSKASDHYLVLMEDDLSVIKALLETPLAKEILYASRVYLYCIEGSVKSEAFTFVELFPFLTYRVIASPAYKTTHEFKFRSVEEKIFFYAQAVNASKGEFLDGGNLIFKNFGRTMERLPNSHFAQKLFGKFNNVPAIICGAGPSIDKQLPLLKTLKDKALIFAGGTAMNAVNAGGVVPHFGIGIDPNFDQYTRLIMNSAFETPFFYCSRMNDEALSLVQGDRLYVSGIGGHKIISWMEKELDIESETVQVGMNVINFSLGLAKLLGCNPIIFIGIDLAYTDVKSYSEGFKLHPIHHPRHFYKTKKVDEEFLVKPDIYGKPTPTLWKWISESGWFTGFKEENPQIQFYNCTEGGIGFYKVPNLPFKEAVEKFLTRQYNLDAMVHGEIELSSFPKPISEKTVTDLLAAFVASLRKCSADCKSIIDKMMAERVLNKSWTPEMIKESCQGIIEPLEKEIAYANLLDSFYKAYEAIVKREELDIKTQETSVNQLEIGKRWLKLYLDRYVALMHTAESNIIMLTPRAAITNAAINSAASKAVISEPPKPAGIYFYQDGHLVMDDPVLNIHIDEKFTPDAKPASKGSDAENMISETRLNGLIHGHSVFQTLDGKKLFSQWYFNGQKMGKGESYYLNGSLKSVVGYVSGLEEGIHRYYFPTGVLKAEIPYKNGELNGAIRLYHPDGSLKRELFFENGKRHGKEQFFDEAGNLYIDVEFDNNRPKGLARAWHTNGKLKLEIDYSAAGQEEIRSWDITGEPVLQNEIEQKDFYYHMAKQTDVVTGTIKQVYQQLVLLGSLVSANTGDQPKTNGKDEMGFLIGIQKLEESMKDLEKKGKQLNDLVAIDPLNPEEALWKTPNQKREIEKLANKLAEDMKTEIGKIEIELKKAFGSFKPKTELPKPNPDLPPKSHDTTI